MNTATPLASFLSATADTFNNRFNRILDAHGNQRWDYDFATRAEYLEMRQQFKTYYRELFAAIRAAKLELKRLHREQQTRPYNERDFGLAATTARQILSAKLVASNATYKLQKAKAQAQVQYLAAKQAETEPA